jgi:hypothetical protein
LKFLKARRETSSPRNDGSQKQGTPSTDDVPSVATIPDVSAQSIPELERQIAELQAKVDAMRPKLRVVKG